MKSTTNLLILQEEKDKITIMNKCTGGIYRLTDIQYEIIKSLEKNGFNIELTAKQYGISPHKLKEFVDKLVELKLFTKKGRLSLNVRNLSKFLSGKKRFLVHPVLTFFSILTFMGAIFRLTQSSEFRINWLIFAALLIILPIFHEFGHVFAIGYWGGEVTEIGLTLKYNLPVFYTLNNYEKLKKPYQIRILLSGIWIECFISALLIIFFKTEIWTILFALFIRFGFTFNPFFSDLTLLYQNKAWRFIQLFLWIIYIFYLARFLKGRIVCLN